jgi:hypothetical protein
VSLAGWTGAGIGEGVTTAPLYARVGPEFAAEKVVLWPTTTTLLLWHAVGGWYYVSDLACKTFGWSSMAFIRRTL